MVVWIDTAFNREIAIPRRQITELGLTEGPFAETVFADGNTVKWKLSPVFFDWFGKAYKTQIVASDGKFNSGRKSISTNPTILHIDYEAKTVSLT